MTSLTTSTRTVQPIPRASSTIRVMHIITRMVKGGAQENTLATTIGFHGNGWESTLVTGPALGPEGSLEPECLSAGVRMLRVPELVREVSPTRDATALCRLVALVRRERPHILHTHTSKAGTLGRLAARWTRVPVVVHTPHGHVFHSYEGRLRTSLFIQLERTFAPWTDRLVALTDTERREHLELGIGRDGQWRTIHSGVDLSPFEASRGLRHSVRAALGIPAEAVVLGTVGRLVPVKGHQYLIDALARLAADRSPLCLLLVGDGPLRGDLVTRARSLGLEVRIHAPAAEGQALERGPAVPAPAARATVHLLGLRRDVPRLLSAMDLFVLPSLNEGMGRVLVEAMAMELPCVASRVSGIPDVVEVGATGLLVPPRDAAALARAIGSLLDDRQTARAMGSWGRQTVVRAFGLERMLDRLELLYRELLEERGILPPPTRST
jgi:glycosyltransferase involved in cell wall biosynthesis